ncbi:MAG: twin-arginine translocase TatA/TatE family subunit [Chryseobacterium sp.]|nr:MAG: twin-arginine translocase TatA/TatE family subunit [Chryseobacterium sp.]
MELSIGEMLVVALVIVVLFGPDKIPSIARELGQGVRKMKGAMEDIKTEIMKETDNPVAEIKAEIDNVKKSVSDLNPMSDVQKQIESMRESTNPFTDRDGSVPPADEHDGPVSRKK